MIVDQLASTSFGWQSNNHKTRTPFRMYHPNTMRNEMATERQKWMSYYYTLVCVYVPIVCPMSYLLQIVCCPCQLTLKLNNTNISGANKYFDLSVSRSLDIRPISRHRHLCFRHHQSINDNNHNISKWLRFLTTIQSSLSRYSGLWFSFFILPSRCECLCIVYFEWESMTTHCWCM